TGHPMMLPQPVGRTRPPLSRSTRLLGAAGLTMFAAVATILIVNALAGDATPTATVHDPAVAASAGAVPVDEPSAAPPIVAAADPEPAPPTTPTARPDKIAAPDAVQPVAATAPDAAGPPTAAL